MNSDNSPLQLAYFLSPDVVGTSVVGGNPDAFDLVVMVSNPQIAAVEVTHITIEIPTGQDISGDISDALNLPNPTYDTTIPWSISASGDTVTVKPSQGQSGYVTGPILFTLPGIIINETPGTVRLTITEYYPDAPKAEDHTTYTLTKLRPTDPVSMFLVTPAVVTNIDTPVTLSWTCTSQGLNDSFGLRIQSTGQAGANGQRTEAASGPAGARPDAAQMLKPCGTSGQCYTAQDGQNGVPYPAVGQTTTFALDVFTPSGSGSLQLVTTLYATVQVVVPSVSQESYAVAWGTGQFLRGHWYATNAASVSIMVGAETVLSGLPADTYVNGYPIPIGPAHTAPQVEVVAHGVNPGANATQLLAPVAVTPVAPIPAGTNPTGIAITPDGSTALVTNNPPTNAITVIDLLATPPAVTNTIPVSDEPTNAGITPDGQYLMVCSVENDWLATIDVAQRQVIATNENVASPWVLAFTPDSAYVLASGIKSNVVSKVEVATAHVVNVITVVDSPSSIAITPDGSLGLVLSASNGEISVIDIASAVAEPTTISTGVGWGAITISPDGSTAIVVDSSTPNSVQIDIPSRTVVAGRLPTGNNSLPAVFTPDGSLAFVPNVDDRTVSIISPATRSIETTIPLAGYPAGIVITPDGLMALVLLANPQMVVAIDIPTLTATPTGVPVGNNPVSIVTTPAGTMALVANMNDNTVSVI